MEYVDTDHTRICSRRMKILRPSFIFNLQAGAAFALPSLPWVPSAIAPTTPLRFMSWTSAPQSAPVSSSCWTTQEAATEKGEEGELQEVHDCSSSMQVEGSMAMRQEAANRRPLASSSTSDAPIWPPSSSSTSLASKSTFDEQLELQ